MPDPTDTTAPTPSRHHRRKPHQDCNPDGVSRGPEGPSASSAGPLKGILAGGATPKPTDPRGPAAAMGIHLTPLASLCLGVVRGWINVARKGRGGQIDESGTAWTRLPADQLRDQLEREFLVEVSTRSIQRALKELEEAQQIRREQRWKHRYKRDYWYALPEEQEALEQHRPRVVASRFRSERQPQRSTYEPTRATGQVLSTPTTTNSQVLDPTTRKPKSERRDPIRIAVEACMRKGRTRPEGFGPKPQAAMAPQERAVGTDQHGRPLKEVWVGGTMHLVVD